MVLRPVEQAPGFRLQTVTVDAGEAQLYAGSGSDLLESLPLSPGLRLIVERFVAEHHKQREFHKRKRDRAADAAGRTGDQCTFLHALSSRSHKSCLLY